MSKRKIWTVATLALLFVLLAIYIEAGLSEGFEGWAYREATEKMSPAFTRVMMTVTHLGDALVVIPFCILLFVFSRTRKTLSLPVAVTVTLSAILNFILKNIFARERPDILRLVNETNYSFPSGHSMNNAALYTILTLLTLKYVKTRPINYILTAFFMFMTLIIGYSRVYLGVHYAGDVLGGWLLGALVAVSVYHFFGVKEKSKIDRFGEKKTK